MVQSKGWDWENANQSPWLKATEDTYYLAEIWKQKGHKKILDLGTGLGRHAVYFAQQGFDVSAIDISEYGIEHLKSWAIKENINVDAIIGDMLQLPYPNKYFDCIFAYHVISHSDTKGVQKIISEMERVLKDNGKVFLSFCSKETTDYIEETANRIDENSIICQKEPEVGVPHFYANLDDIIGLLHSFEIEKIRHTEYCSLDLQDKQKNKYYYINAIYKPKK